MASTAFHAPSIDALTQADLVAGGSDKWTRFPDCIGAFIAEMDFGCPAPVTEALQRAVASGSLGYLSQTHVSALAEATARYLERDFAWVVDPAWVRPLADIVQAYQAFLQHFVAPGSAIIVPTPAYMPFLSLPEALGVEVIEVPMLEEDDGWRIDAEGIQRAFRDGAKALVLCHPHNPIGKVYSAGELRQVSELVEAAGAVVFSDEIHAPLMLTEGRAHIPYASISPEAAAHSVTALSASKAFNIPGVKCCQIVLTSEVHRAKWQQVGVWSEHQTSTLGVHATIAAYEAGGEWLAGAIEYLRENVRLAVDTLRHRVPSVKVRLPDATYLLWVDVRDTPFWAMRESDDAALELRRRSGVAVNDGRACGEVGEGFIRVNVAMPRPILVAALDQMVRAFTANER